VGPRGLVVTAFLLLVAAGADAHGDKQVLEQPPDFDTRVLARVNDAVITGRDFHRAFDALGADQQLMVRRNVRKFLETLVQREVLYQAALRAGLDRDPDVIARLADIRRAVLSQELLHRERAEAARAAPPDAARRYYDAHREEFTTTERISVSHILVKTREEADAVVARLRGGADFAALAQEVSRDDASRDRGGRIPVVYRGQMSRELEAAAFALTPGQLSGVAQDADGYHVLVLHGHVPAAPTPFESVRTSIERKLAATQLDQHLKDVIAALERQAHIEMTEGALGDVR
jgi:parvulin-like peptidyl-prolyl isomerase